MKSNKHVQLVLLAVAFIALAAIVYFNLNPTGKAVANGCTKVISGGDINQFSSSIIPGDIVCVRAGTYSGTLKPNNNGTASQKITFKAYPGDECETHLNMSKYDCKVKLSAIYTSKEYTRFEGFEIRNGDSGIVINADNVEVVNNYIHNMSADAIDIGWHDGAKNIIYNFKNILIDNNEIYFCLGDGMNIYGNFVTIRKNYVHVVGDDVMSFHPTGGNGHVIEYNKMGGFDRVVCPSCHPDLFETYELSNFVIRYNELFDMTQLVYLAPDFGEVVENGDIYGNVFYNKEYWIDENKGVGGGDVPGIYLCRTKSGTINDIRIFSNTFGWLGPDGEPSPTSADNYKGVQLDSGVTNVKVYNNIFYNSHTGFEDNKVTSDYNLFYCSGLTQAQCDLPDWGKEGGHSKYGDPKFVHYKTPLEDINMHTSSYDFRLQSGSPAIDAANFVGSGLNLPSPYLDRDGNIRSLPYDIGAYEFGQCAPSCINKQCGSDGCGGSCGTCGEGYSCDATNKCIPDIPQPCQTCSDLGFNCGIFTNNCNEQLNCGTCSQGYSCSNNKCTLSCKTCTDYPNQCGTFDNGCGGAINCGCASEKSCYNQKCYPNNCLELFNGVTSSFGTDCGNVNYKPIADLNKDRTIDVFDLLTIGENLNNNIYCTNAVGNNADPCSCVENWQCGQWSTCINGLQTRACTDLNNCGTTVSKPIGQQSCGNCSTAQFTWQNKAFTQLNSIFSVEFDVMPVSTNLDLVIGLSKGIARDYKNLSALIRFDENGFIDVRNNATYAENIIGYTAGQNYHFTMTMYPIQKKYFVKVTSGTTTNLGTFNFRDSARVSALNNFAIIEGLTEGSSVCNFKLTKLTACVDSDKDGFSPKGSVCGTVDCNDSNAAIKPGAVERCDGIDNNCNGSVDDNCI